MRIFVNFMKAEGRQLPEEDFDADLDDGLPPSPEQVQRAIAGLRDVVAQAVSEPGDLCNTWVVLARELEKRPHLQGAAIEVYHEAIATLRELGSRHSWENIVARQMVGALSLKGGLLDDARRWLSECAALVVETPGHPRDRKLFGTVSSRHSRGEFAAMVARLRAKERHDSGDVAGARSFVEESKRLLEDPLCPVGRSVAPPLCKPGATDLDIASDLKQLWVTIPDQSSRILRYRFEGGMSDSSIVTVELNEHLDIGEAASLAVQSLGQIRVACTTDSVEARVRLQHQGRLCEFVLHLLPLAREIIPQDTIPKLRGKPDRRRLELLLIMRDKGRGWNGELLSDRPRPRSLEKVVLSQPGTLSSAPPLLPLPQGQPPPRTMQQAPQSTPHKGQRRPSEGAEADGALPRWVESVKVVEAPQRLTLAVKLSSDISPQELRLEDLDLGVNEDTGVARLAVRGRDLPEATLTAPLGAALAEMTAKWRRAAGILELRFPSALG